MTSKLRQVLNLIFNIYIPDWQDLNVQIYAAKVRQTKSADSPRPNLPASILFDN